MRIRKIGIMFIALHLFLPTSLTASNFIMPGELISEAKKLGCSQVQDFFDDRYFMVLPPYVYGYVSGNETRSAAFWCEKKSNDTRAYFLAFMLKDNNAPFGNCPRMIEWKNPPGGLSIYTNRDRKLSDFIYMDEPKVQGPNIYPEHNAIMSTYGGTAAIFYCYKGKWLLLQLD